MAHIHSIQIGSGTYLIEPFVYVAASGTGSAYTATLANYEEVGNSVLFLTVPANNAANVTLAINGETPVPIYYQGSAVDVGALEANQTYALTYDTNKWHVLNNLDGGASFTIDSNGGLENGNDGLKIKSGGIVNGMIANNTIANGKLANSSITIAGNTVSLGGSISLADLGLSQVLHFKGVALNNKLADGSLKDPFSTAQNPPNYSGDLGDVVLDINKEYEYLWAGNSDGWILLGGNDQYKIVQTAVSDPTASGATNAFISSISQNANGDITVSKKYVQSWQYARKVYADLTTDSTTTTINGDTQNASAVGIGVHGILPVDNGGTGSDDGAWAQGGILYGALTNNKKYYTSVSGQQYQILTSGGTGVPVWATAALLESIVTKTANANNYTSLELGNDVDIASTTSGHSEGRIILFSAGTEAHFLRGAKTNHTGGYEHFLPNADGYLLQATSASAVGSNTNPVYIAANGVATALTYTANRLYYSASTTSFEATSHYANTTQIGINITTWPTVGNQPIADNLYVNGASTFTGVLKITNTTDVATNTSGALVVDGGATITKKLRVTGDVTFTEDLSVTGTSTLTNNVGIGTAPDTATSDNHKLVVNGSILLINGTTNVAHLDVGTSNSTLTFRPETSAVGHIGTGSKRWNDLYLSNIINVTDNGSSYVVTINDSNTSSRVATMVITSTTPKISLNTISNSIANWYISNNAGIFTISDSNNSEIFGNAYGFRLQGRLYINAASALTDADDLDLYVDGTSELLGAVGIGAGPISNFILYVEGNSKFKGHIYPESDDTYNLGMIDANGSLRWKNLYLSNTFNLSNAHNVNASINMSVVGASNAGIAELTLTAVSPKIILETTATGAGVEDWTLQNASGIFTISNSVQTLRGDYYGFRLNSYLYIDAAVPSSNPYNLYVNGTTYHTGDVSFTPATTSANSPKLYWSGASDDAAIYYKVNSAGNAGYLVIDTNNDSCLIALAASTVDTMYINTDTPSFYPQTTNSGSLGLTTNRWATMYIGTANSYGDAYTSIYWHNGVPEAVTPIQYVEFTIGNGYYGVTLSHSAFTANSYVMQIVVTSGASGLNSEISWDSETTGQISLTCTTATSSAVSGYILVSRGDALSVTVTDITSNT